MTLLSVQASKTRILKHFHPVKPETAPLQDCAGRILGTDIYSIDLPPFDNSSVDGFAARAVDLRAVSISNPVKLRVIGETPAGSITHHVFGPGQAIRIMIGAPLPRDADAVIMLEDTSPSLRPAVFIHNGYW
jgi:molybdopterin molybdotransferase